MKILILYKNVLHIENQTALSFYSISFIQRMQLCPEEQYQGTQFINTLYNLF